MNTDKEYILGTQPEELRRLGLQHQVWSSEARKGWEIAEFGKNQTILDLGCGPGFCAMELGYMTGEYGKVIAIDQSQAYINFLKQQSKMHGLKIDARCNEFNSMKLIDFELDGVFSRWALAWIDNPEEIIAKIVQAMSPGAAFVAHEYYDWMTFQSEPEMNGLKHGLSSCFKSFGDTGGNINIGRQLPQMFFDAGLEVVSTRLMTKLALPDDLTWEWPKSFFETYFPRLVPSYLSEVELEDLLADVNELEDIDGASIFCPTMVEVVAVK